MSRGAEPAVSRGARRPGSLEQIVECLARTVRCGGLRLALDGSARLELQARVARLLRPDAVGSWLLTFECGARVEIAALRARVQVGAAAGARAVGAPRRRDGQLVAAPVASNRFSKTGHVERLRPVGRLTSWRVLFLGGLRAVPPR